MKIFVKMLCLLLAVSVMAGLFVSCGGKYDYDPNYKPKQEGDILVVYNNTAIFESEVQDIINYQLMRGVTDTTTEEQMMIMMGEAVGKYVQYKTLELDFNERGIKVDEKAVEELYNKELAGIEENYEGGYENWMKIYGVSEHFLQEEVRRYVLADMYYEEVRESITFTDDDLKAYMNLHASDYYNPAGYTWTMVFREVKDITDAAECAAAEQEAQELINKIQKGETTLEEVKVDLLEKYTAKDGYGKAEMFNGENFTSMDTLIPLETEEQLNEVLANLDRVYSMRDPKADQKSEAYTSYMNWVAECFKAYSYYALCNTEVGKVYEKPMLTFAGYGILRLDSVVTTSTFEKFEDVKADLAYRYLEEKLQERFHAHLETLHEKYKVEYLYTDF